MKIATYNINGIKARLPRILEWLGESKPDVALLQEIKSIDDNFPRTIFEEKGYKMLKENFREVILNLAEKDKVILFYPIPTANKKIIREVNNLYIKNKENEKIGIKLSVFLDKQKFIFDFFNTIEHKNIIKIYPHKLLCEKEDDICVFYDGKNMIYYDKIHFTSYGSKIINNLILRTIKNLN